MKNLQALHDWIIIKEIKKEEKKSESEFLLPETNSTIGKGEVLFAGPGKFIAKTNYSSSSSTSSSSEEIKNLIPTSVSKGNTVLYSKPSSDEIEIEGEKLILVRDESIIAIYK